MVCDELSVFTGCNPNCRIALLHVSSGDTAHGGPPWLVSPPASDNLGCTLFTYDYQTTNYLIQLR